jgi:NADH dehydrogenase
MSRPDNLASPHRVVVIGSGFGGLFATKSLHKAPVQLTLIDRSSHHLFQPLLYQVATGILSEGEIAPATREILRGQPNARVILGDVTDIDLDARTVSSAVLNITTVTPYDSLIVAAGSTHSYFGNDGFEQFAPGMKSVADAMELRRRIFGAYEIAEVETDLLARDAWLTFVVVGGGPTGVEMAGQLRELSRRALRRNYRMIDPVDTRVVLVEGLDRLIGSMGPYLSRLTARDLTRMGVEIHLGAKVTNMDEDGVEITKQDGSTERIPAATKVWAAGTRAAGLGITVAEAAGAQTDKAGRVMVNPDCSLPSHPEVFVVGDLMAHRDELPGVAEVAMQSGAHAARSIVRRLEGKPTKPFQYRDLGTLAVISRFRAVAEIGPLRVGGIVGWLLWLVVHITFLTGFKNRFGALARWVVSFVGRGRYERALTGRWVARAKGTTGSA